MRIRLAFLLTVCAILAPGCFDFASAQTHTPGASKSGHHASHTKLPIGQTGSAKTESAPLRSASLNRPAQNNGNTALRVQSAMGARNGISPPGNLRHRSPNAAVGGPAGANSKGTAAIDGRRMGRKP
jgi:hypothetical protein